MISHPKTNSKTTIHKSPSDSYWKLLITCTCVYIVVFIAGYFLKLPVLNIVGVYLLFVILLIGRYKIFLKIKKDPTIYIALLILLVPIFNMLINLESIGPAYLIKHIAIYLLYILIFSFSLSPLYETNKRTFFLVIISILLVLSVISGKIFEFGEEVRLTGLFVNPNNLSLISLSLLFFVNEEEDTVFKKGILNLFVIVILIVSSTAGAIVAYIAANAYKYRKKIKKMYISVPLILAIFLLIFLILNPREYQFSNKIINQYTVINEKISDVTSMKEINYGSLASQYGTSSLSGIWRLALWIKALNIISNNDVVKFFFGNGIGSSRKLLGYLPHNEYLRIFLEQGLIGFILNMVFFVIIWFRINSRYKYLLLMFAIFSFTENNFDNFLFMSLFVFFIASVQVEKNKAVMPPIIRNTWRAIFR